MRILIIEQTGHKYTRAGVSLFELAVKQELLHLRHLIESEVEFILRTPTDLEDLLYEQSSGFLRKENSGFFDSISFVFVNCTSYTQPWSKKIEKLNIFLRMCIKTSKPVYASGLAFFSLILLCATDLEKGSLNVINGQGNGSNLESIGKEILLQKVIDENDVFLDHTTGDIYRYNYDVREWVPKGNMGMHRRVVSEDNRRSLRYLGIHPVPKFKVHDGDKLLPNVKDEAIVYLKRNCITHWCVLGCPNKFIVRKESQLESHPINFKEESKTFEVLAESETGPQIILFKGESILATEYHLNSSYPTTMIPFKNFINRKLTEMKNGVRLPLSIVVADGTWYSSEQLKEKRKDHTIGEINIIPHIGMQPVVKDLTLVENNALFKESYKAKVLDRSRRIGAIGRKRRKMLERITQPEITDYNKKYKEQVRSSSNFVKPPPVIKSPDIFKISDTNANRQQEEGFRFKHPGVMKKKLYGNIRILRSDGFDFDDGWVPGYRSQAKRVDPLIDEQAEPVLINDKNKYVKDVTKKARAYEASLRKALANCLKGPEPVIKPIAKVPIVPREEHSAKSDETLDPDKEEQKPELESESQGSSQTLQDEISEEDQSGKDQESQHADPNIFVRRDVIIRKSRPEYYSRYKQFEKKRRYFEENNCFYAQPYQNPKVSFR
jgi:hypothetical protein